MRARSLAWTVAAALGTLAVVTWPLATKPTELLAHPLGEGNNHYWMLWRALQGATPVANLPDGLELPLMDPVNLLFGAPWVWLSPPVAYNAVVCGNLLLAFAGAWALARSLDLGLPGSAAAGIAALSAPFLSGAVDFGLTEALPVGWLGLHAACLLQGGRSNRPGWWLAAGLTLAAFALSGWYHALFGLVAEGCLVLWVGLRHRRLTGLVAQGGLAFALVLPRFLNFLELRTLWAERWHSPSPLPPDQRVAWRELPIYGTDLLNLVLPSTGTVEVSKSVYLGLVALALALAAGRRAWPLLAVALPLWILSLGHWLGVGGDNLLFGRPIALPARWLQPLVEGLSHWHRAAGPASLFLAVAAGMGVERLSRGRLGVVAVLVGAMLADGVLFSQTPWPRATTPTGVPAAYLSLQGEGAVVQLPFDNGRREFSQELPRIYNLWQPGFGRGVAENYEGPDALLRQKPTRGNRRCALRRGELGPP